MLVTLSSKLVGVLGLGLYVSGVSATPTAFNPNTPALLVPRVLPADNTCGNKGLWQRRECDPQYGTTAWFDLCVKSGAPNFQVASRCPSNTVCQNFHDGKDSSIKCVNQQPAGTSVARSTRDPMIGYSGIFTAPSFVNRNFPFRFTVTIQDDMKASVAAFVLSKDGSFVVAPNNVLVGTVHDKAEVIVVCSGDGSNVSRTKECYPTGKYQLSKGDRINFRWGMTKSQAGSLAYTIWPSD